MKLLIFGSCVTRDALEYSDKEKITLVNYFARSSLGSAFYGEKVAGVDVGAIDSAFQRRIVIADIDKSFPEFLKSTDFDLVIYDGIDERFNLVRQVGGGICTLSNEFAKTNFHKNNEVSIIESGSSEFFELWQKGWEDFLKILEKIGRKRYLRINKVYWAESVVDGGDFLPSYSPSSILEANKFLKKIYERMAKDIPQDQFYCFGSEVLKGCTMHKWGKSPFHYVKEYYSALVDKILSETEEVSLLANEEPVGTKFFHKLLIDQISERNIVKRSLGWPHRREFLRDDNEFAESPKPLSNGKISFHHEFMEAKFSGSSAGYYVDLPLPKACFYNGLTVQYRLKSWSEIKYVAIGFLSQEGFKHVKIVHPVINEWSMFSLGLRDIIFGIQNGWESPGSNDVSSIRIYIKGVAGDLPGATIDVQWFSLWEESFDAFQYLEAYRLRKLNCREEVFSTLKGYFKKCNADITFQAEMFMESGRFPLNGQSYLDWSPERALPEGFNDVGTYRYLWHALQPAISMMVYFEESEKLAALFAARDFINSWLDNSFFKPDPDKKFTWYDHGAAERLLALLYMHNLGERYGFDCRFQSKLHLACVAHAQLLESDAFYASHQISRYHNHAWFQDIALIAIAAAYPDLPAADRWLKKGNERLNDQLKNLIIRDEGYAIFVENSIGYHNGIQRLVGFAGDLISISGTTSSIPEVSDELELWSRFFRYPDNRSPSQGDTFRRPNLLDKPIALPAYENPSCTILSKAGYGVVKANHDSIPYMLCMFSTSICKTHKHEDDLSFTLFFDGVEWLIDPSFYSHEYKSPLPAFLRSAWGHNVVAIKNATYSIEPGLSQLSGKIIDSEFELFGDSAACEGYDIRRSIRGSLESLSLVVHDQVINKSGLVEGFQLFQLGEGVKAILSDQGAELYHPASAYKLFIASHKRPCMLSGWQDDRAINGVSGAGFMERLDRETLYFEMDGSSISTSIQALSITSGQNL